MNFFLVLAVLIAGAVSGTIARAESCVAGALYVYDTGLDMTGNPRPTGMEHYYCPATGVVGIAISSAVGWIRPIGLRSAERTVLATREGGVGDAGPFPKCEVRLPRGEFLPLSQFNERPCQYAPGGYVPPRKGVCFTRAQGWAPNSTCSTP